MKMIILKTYNPGELLSILANMGYVYVVGKSERTGYNVLNVQGSSLWYYTVIQNKKEGDMFYLGAHDAKNAVTMEDFILMERARKLKKIMG